MERLHSVFEKIISALYKPLAPELVDFQTKVLEGEVPELLAGGKTPRIFEHYGNTLRIRIPWGEDGLEKSYIAKIDNKTGDVTCKLEGFFHSDKRDWPR